MTSIAFNATHAGLLLHRLHQRLSAVELVYTSHAHWPLPPAPHRPSRLRISVLDSSFNPPTRAHLALANWYPPLQPYDANLLLLSVRNADKYLKPNDASHTQRLAMMLLLAKEIEQENVAIAIIDEPTFVGKSSTLLEFLKQRLSVDSPTEPSTAPTQPHTLAEPPNLQLEFLQGTDTLERLFAPHYYPSQQAMLVSLRRFFSPEGDDSRVICARRPSSLREVEESEPGKNPLLLAEEFISSGRVVLIDIGVDERTFSSTAVRNGIARGEKGWKRSVPDEIAGYIVEQGLYSNG